MIESRLELWCAPEGHIRGCTHTPQDQSTTQHDDRSSQEQDTVLTLGNRGITAWASITGA